MTCQKVIRQNDIVMVNGRPRLVVMVGLNTLVTGYGRGYRKYWTKDQVREVIARNFKLKPGKTFDGATG